jgi:hypothetical protein
VRDPVGFVRELAREDKLSTYFWVLAYYVVNVYLFFSTLATYAYLIDDVQAGLLDGTLHDLMSHRKAGAIIRHGFLSRFAPWAKACGFCLNFNCALILMPVTKLLLARLNNVGRSYSSSDFKAGRVTNNALYDAFARFFAHPFTRYVPLSKNIETHKHIAKVIFVLAVGHTLFHFANYCTSQPGTLNTFRRGRYYPAEGVGGWGEKTKVNRDEHPHAGWGAFVACQLIFVHLFIYSFIHLFIFDLFISVLWFF